MKEPYKFTIFETNCPTCKSPVRYTTNDRDLTCHGCHTTFEGVASARIVGREE